MCCRNAAGQTIMISNDVCRQSRSMLPNEKYAVDREAYCHLRSIPLAGKHLSAENSAASQMLAAENFVAEATRRRRRSS